jgi:hypothetical protein
MSKIGLQRILSLLLIAFLTAAGIRSCSLVHILVSEKYEVQYEGLRLSEEEQEARSIFGIELNRRKKEAKQQILFCLSAGIVCYCGIILMQRKKRI